MGAARSSSRSVISVCEEGGLVSLPQDSARKSRLLWDDRVKVFGLCRVRFLVSSDPVKSGEMSSRYPNGDGSRWMSRAVRHEPRVGERIERSGPWNGR